MTMLHASPLVGHRRSATLPSPIFVAMSWRRRRVAGVIQHRLTEAEAAIFLLRKGVFAIEIH